MSDKTIKFNKHAVFKFAADRTYESGIVLKGADVKAIRANQCEIRDAFIKEDKGELFVWNIIFPHSGSQKRKLLLHRQEISRIIFALKEKRVHGFITAMKISDNNLVKLEIGVGTLKKNIDKKMSQKRSTEKRTLEREVARKNL